MAFRFDTSRDPLAELVRAASRAVEAAARSLRAGLRAGDAAELAAAVHEARKSLRRARAMVELLRPWLGGEAAGDLITALRDARRRLAGARDASVVLEALREAAKERGAGPALPAGDLAALRRRLAEDRDAELTRFDAAALPPVLALLLDAHRSLRAAAGRAAAEAARTPEASVEALGRGLARLHRRARRAAQEAAAAPDSDRLHRARRRWKELGYVLAWWSPAWPRLLRAWLDQVDEVVDLLGREHDQAVLRARLQAVGAIAPALLDVLTTRSARRGARLRARSLPRLSRLAAERTAVFAERHVAYLAAACAANAC